MGAGAGDAEGDALLRRGGAGGHAPWSNMRMARFAALYGAFYLTVVYLLAILVPLRVAEVDPDNKSSYLGFVVTAGNIVIVIMLLFMGWVSDTIRTPLGNRKPQMALGMSLTVISMIPIQYGNEPWIITVGFCMYCGGASVALPPYFATMVDYVPPRQHNTISAWTNGMGQGGGMLGSLLAVFIESIGQVPLTWATDAFMALAVIITLTSFSEARVDEPVRPRKRVPPPVDMGGGDDNPPSSVAVAARSVTLNSPAFGVVVVTEEQVLDSATASLPRGRGYHSYDPSAGGLKGNGARSVNGWDGEDDDEEVETRSSRRCGCQTSGLGFVDTVKSMGDPMRKLNFVLLWVAAFFFNAESTIVQLFSLYYFTEVLTDYAFFGITLSSSSSATAVYSLLFQIGAFVANLLLIPALARTSRRFIFVLGLALNVLGPLAFVLEASYVMCALAALLSGFGNGYGASAGTAMAAHLLAVLKAEQGGDVGGNGFGMFQLGVLSPKAVVPVVAGFLIKHYEAVGSADGIANLGYTVVFAFATGLGVLATFFGFFIKGA